VPSNCIQALRVKTHLTIASWEALARMHGRRNDLLGLDSTVRRLRNALADAGDNSDPDTVILPPALVRVFDEMRVSLLACESAGRYQCRPSSAYLARASIFKTLDSSYHRGG
jgi:hypothetical protein